MLFTYMGIGVMNIMPNIVAATAMISFSVMLWNLFCGEHVPRSCGLTAGTQGR